MTEDLITTSSLLTQTMELPYLFSHISIVFKRKTHSYILEIYRVFI
jgi:hypothetical protein